MKVLSLFDGMSCGRIALDQLGIPVEKYYASEIDKYAMQVSAANYPDIEQVGDICDLDPKRLYMDVNLMLAGSHLVRDLVLLESNWLSMTQGAHCSLSSYACSKQLNQSISY
jgi:hypothetical protein